MASAVQLCNLSLSHLGAEARVVSISPPDGSVEAGYCASFYPIARKVLLTTFEWAFASKRAALAEVTNNSNVWAYAYAVPADCIKPWRVLKAGATQESDGADFEQEDGVIYTNESEAVLVYTRDITDTTKFTAAFDSALTWLLASYLAGPVLKGSEGANASIKLLDRALKEGSQAAASSANSSSSRHMSEHQIPDSIKART